MNAMKVEQDNVKAVRRFREAIALNPKHEDSRYYLGLCLASQGNANGALLVLGEVASLRGDLPLAEKRLAATTHTNPRAVGGLFLRGYLAWKRGDPPAARQLLEPALTALGPDWRPKGTTSEGDVIQQQQVEQTPLTPWRETWRGQVEPEAAFQRLEEGLNRRTH